MVTHNSFVALPSIFFLPYKTYNFLKGEHANICNHTHPKNFREACLIGQQCITIMCLNSERVRDLKRQRPKWQPLLAFIIMYISYLFLKALILGQYTIHSSGAFQEFITLTLNFFFLGSMPWFDESEWVSHCFSELVLSLKVERLRVVYIFKTIIQFIEFDQVSWPSCPLMLLDQVHLISLHKVSPLAQGLILRSLCSLSSLSIFLWC